MAARLDDPNLEALLARMPKAEMHFHFEGAFRWNTIRELHPRGQELPERQSWLAQARPFADFQDFTQLFRDYIRPATGTPAAIDATPSKCSREPGASERALCRGHRRFSGFNGSWPEPGAGLAGDGAGPRPGHGAIQD